MRRTTTTGILLGVCISVTSASAVLAGPCTSDIADLGRKLSASSSLGPVTTGTLNGSGPGTVQTSAATPQPATAGTTADKSVGGTAGTKEMNAAAAQVATSADDVRRQQQGLPTAAQAAAQASMTSVETAPGQTSKGPDDRMSEAKMELEKARTLDQQGDGACSTSIKRVRDLMGS